VIMIKDSIIIGGLNSAFILANAQNATQYANFLVRGAPDGNASGLGPITGIIQTTANLFKVRVSGYDVDLKYRAINDGGHRLVMQLNGSYVWEFKRQNADGSYSQQADQALNAAGGVIPRWHHVASLAYDRGPWSASLMQNYQKGYHDLQGNLATTPRNVGSYETWDLQGSWMGLKSVKLTLGVKNLLDRDPPYTNAGGQFAAGFDIAYADVRGRFVYAAATYTFK
jgi:iron complex outermembrane receptor protein